jgi:hypothetical protein
MSSHLSHAASRSVPSTPSSSTAATIVYPFWTKHLRKTDTALDMFLSQMRIFFLA